MIIRACPTEFGLYAQDLLTREVLLYGTITDIHLFVEVSYFLMFSPNSNEPSVDVGAALTRYSQYVLIVAIGILPIFFIPNSFVALGYTKAVFVSVAVIISAIILFFAMLRNGAFSIPLSTVLGSFTAIVLVSLVSGLLSDDWFDALIGTNFTTQSIAGLTLLGVVMLLGVGLSRYKQRAVKLFMLLLISTSILMVYHLLRVFFGAEFITFGVFNTTTSSPIGTWNDFAILLGLVTIMSLFAVGQLPLSKVGRTFFIGLIVAALALLMVVNFSFMWIVLGFVSLFVLVFSLTYQRFSATPTLIPESNSSSVSLIAVSGIIFFVSVLNIVGGGSIGAMVNQMTGISYVEVRPSVSATIDIAQASLRENVLFGIGPNQFVDGWRLYKDESINNTVFWNTEFSAGSGLIPTSMVELGLLGVIAWLIFLGAFLTSGVHAFLRTDTPDKLLNFILIASFVSSLYLWIVSVLYVPTISIMLLAALFTGIFVGVKTQLLPTRSLALTIENNRKAAFVLVAVAMVLIVAAIGALYYIGQHYIAHASFARAVSTVDSVETLTAAEATIARNFELVADDLFARELALLQLARMNSLLGVTEPTAAQQQEFQTATVNGINAAQAAITADRGNPLNWRVLAEVYAVLSVANVEGTVQSATDALAEAKIRDPKNPVYVLLEARLAGQSEDTERARELTLEAIQLKRNYTDALFYLTQIEVAEGNVDQAIATTEAIIALEPQNPARYYQLGVLYSSVENTEASIAAFAEAVRLNPEFANARYFLALSLFQNGNQEESLAQLRIVLEANPDNEELAATIAAIESGEVVATDNRAPVEAVSNDEVLPEAEGEQVVVTDDPDTDLIAPVNTVPDAPREEVVEGDEVTQ